MATRNFSSVLFFKAILLALSLEMRTLFEMLVSNLGDIQIEDGKIRLRVSSIAASPYSTEDIMYRNSAL
jgi:hypothetical protein